MKKWMFLPIVLFALPLTMTAQDDDMYFVPKKAKTVKQTVTTPASSVGIYYSGSNRDVDEYNRWGGSNYDALPTDTGDIISFSALEGVYPDSTSDYNLTRQMARWEGYEPSQVYLDGYTQGRKDASLSWHSPWYYSSYYPWYDSWYYDPWYYHSSWSWRYGWYDPWYYDYYYWNYPPYHYYGWYGGGWGFAPGGGGALNPRPYTYHNGRGTIDRYGRSGNGGFSGYRGGRGTQSGTSSSSRSSSRFGRASSRGVSGHTINGSSSVGVRSTPSGNNSGSFSGTRSSGSTYSGGGSYSGSSSSGSFSGSRSSGGGGGGFSSSRSSGGGGGGRSGSSRR